jgi:hypothetical protein
MPKEVRPFRQFDKSFVVVEKKNWPHEGAQTDSIKTKNELTLKVVYFSECCLVAVETDGVITAEHSYRSIIADTPHYSWHFLISRESFSHESFGF